MLFAFSCDAGLKSPAFVKMCVIVMCLVYGLVDLVPEFPRPTGTAACLPVHQTTAFACLSRTPKWCK